MNTFYTEYKDLIKQCLMHNYNSKQISDTLYNREMNRYYRIGFKPRVDEINQIVNAIFETKSVDKPKQTLNFINAVVQGRTLFVGEGNFSFCLSIARQIRNPYNIIATTNEAQNEFSDLTKQNINSLQRLGVKVFQKTDATQIHKDFAGQAFNKIIFQFPHTGSREPIQGRNPNFILLRDFLKSAKHLLSYGGKVVVSIVDSPYYQGAFQIEEAGTEAKYKRYSVYKFNPLLFPNYIHTMTNEDESAISKNDDLITIVFE